jgi:hypothetical protein
MYGHRTRFCSAADYRGTQDLASQRLPSYMRTDCRRSNSSSCCDAYIESGCRYQDNY